MSDRETELRQQLHAMRVRFQAEAQPIMDELVKIEIAKPQPYTLYSLSEAKLRPETVERIRDRLGLFTGAAPESPAAAHRDEDN